MKSDTQESGVQKLSSFAGLSKIAPAKNTCVECHGPFRLGFPYERVEGGTEGVCSRKCDEAYEDKHRSE